MTQTQLSDLCGAVHAIGMDNTETIEPTIMAKLATICMVRFIGARVELTDKGEATFTKIESGDPEDDDLSGDFR